MHITAAPEAMAAPAEAEAVARQGLVVPEVREATRMDTCKMQPAAPTEVEVEAALMAAAREDGAATLPEVREDPMEEAPGVLRIRQAPAVAATTMLTVLLMVRAVEAEGAATVPTAEAAMLVLPDLCRELRAVTTEAEAEAEAQLPEALRAPAASWSLPTHHIHFPHQAQLQLRP